MEAATVTVAVAAVGAVAVAASRVAGGCSLFKCLGMMLQLPIWAVYVAPHI